jgi:ribonuclease HI
MPSHRVIYTIFADAQSALQRCATDAIGCSNSIMARDNTIILRWVPDHKGVAGDEEADERAGR